MYFKSINYDSNDKYKEVTIITNKNNSNSNLLSGYLFCICNKMNKTQVALTKTLLTTRQYKL